MDVKLGCLYKPCFPIKAVLFISSFLIYSSCVIFEFQGAYAIDDYNFGAAGDWGCNSNTDNTVSNMVGKSPNKVFGLGDYSYASTGTCWFEKIVPIDSVTEISFGNHEDQSSEGFSGYMSHFGLSKTYYSFNHENAHILVMDTDVNSYSSGSSQHSFIVNDLQSAAQNPTIDWIIVYLHKPMYTSPNSCSSSGCTNGGSTATSLRNTYHALFDQYGVDLVLAGHVHNYQRTFPLNYNPSSPSNPTKTSSNANDYTDPEGQIFAIVGTGGVNFHPLSGKASFVSSQQDDFFGQLDLKITNNGAKLEGRFYRNGDGQIQDSFSITKTIGNSPPVANNQAVAVNKNTAKAVTLTATDPNNDPLTYSIVTPPAHGILTGTAPNLMYNPTTGYVGPDSFTFKANDGTTDSNIATVSITVQDPASCTTNLAITGVTASGSEATHPPTHAIDNNFGTRWANPALGSSITADLGSTQNICSVDIAWYNGNARQYHFIIATSTNGISFSNVFSGDSSGTTVSSEKYVFAPIDARYVRVTINGNTQNNAASMYELDIFGSLSSLTTPYHHEPSLSLSGP